MQYHSCFIAFDQANRLPPMTLVAQRSDAVGSPAVPDSQQGEKAIDPEFDVRVRVYCESKHDNDVARVLTPSVRAALLQLTRNCDLGLVGGRVYVIARSNLDLTQAPDVPLAVTTLLRSVIR